MGVWFCRADSSSACKVPLRLHKGGRKCMRGQPEESDPGIEDREVGSTLYISVSLEERDVLSQNNL